MDSSEWTPIQTGSVFEGRYEILESLGAGGFGEVFRATQCSTGQDVAIKMIHQPVGELDEQKKRRMRFEREMALCARLYHPNIVRLIDSGETPEGRLYTVLSYIPGQSLSALLRSQGALEGPMASHLMAQVLDALSAAHRAGVVHRDLKPSNIMVTQSGARPNALVLDFGIGAFLTQPANRKISLVTGTSELIGTPSYAAPEHLRGNAATPRGDLYSWALVLLECLTGVPVMTGDSFAEILFKQLGPEPVPIPEWLRRGPVGSLLELATRKDEAERSVTAEGLLDALMRCDLFGIKAGGRRTWTEVGRETFLGMSTPKAAPTERLARGDFTDSPFPSVSGDRRQVTVVCIDLHLDRLGLEDSDPETFAAAMRASLETCQDIALRFGAHLGAPQPDRLLLYFGYPETREDDVRRAARAAQALLEAFASSAHASGQRPESPEGKTVESAQLQIGIGIHTGIVPIREAHQFHGQGPDLIGATAYLATKIAARAPVGAVLVSESAGTLLRRWFEFAPEGEQAFPGSREGTKLYRLQGKEAITPSLSSLSGAEVTPLVGRRLELGLLKDRWRFTCENNGQSVLISGEPGVGKSRLVRELIALTDRKTSQWLECRCAEENRNSHLRPIVELIEQLMGLSSGSSMATKQELLMQLLFMYELPLETNMPLLSALLDLPPTEQYPRPDVSPERAKELTLEAVVNLLFAIADRKPLAFIVEDLHWADPTTLEFLGRLLNEVSSASLMAVMTARPEFTSPWNRLDLLQIQVSRLSREDIREMVLHLTRDKPVPEEVLEEIARRTDGISLFVEELTRMLLESGTLEEQETEYRLKGRLSDVQVPFTLRGLLAARLDSQGSARRTAQLASALGRDFSVELLTAVSTQEPDVVTRALEQLVFGNLLVYHRRRKGLQYSFRHALIRDMAYESMLMDARRAVHARIADTLERRFPEMAAGRPELLVYHHSSAGSLEVASEYAVKAGMKALQQSSNQDAIAVATQALSWLPSIDDPIKRAERELALLGIIRPGQMATRGFGDPSIEENVARSQLLIDQIGDSALAVPALWALAFFHALRSNYDSCLELSERMLEISRAAGNLSQEVAALMTAGLAALGLGALTDARRYFTQCIERYDRVAHRDHAVVFGMDSLTMSHCFMGLTETLAGNPGLALQHVAASRAWAEEVNISSNLTFAVYYTAMVRAHLDLRDGIPEICQFGLETCQRLGLPVQLFAYRMMDAYSSGNKAGMDGVLAFYDAVGARQGNPMYRTMRASMELDDGDPAWALAHLEATLKLTFELKELLYLAETLRLKGAFLERAHPADLEAAEACYREALAVARDQTAGWLELKASLSLSRLLSSLGRRDEARALLAPAAARFGDELDLPVLNEVRQLLSTL